MPVQRPGAVQAHVSCFDRVKMGALMGFAIGMASGAIFGTATAFRYGLRGRELLSNTAKIMLQGGGTFSVFLAIGSALLSVQQYDVS
ncbi:reactive oxygen species modulator 1-like [Corticium candelabrum]|uniref:reactive oxygen species modulator 1-like n=1 Tax=Corticium candelabrum TaxID=121492 RepID=UPI002E262837|nr:reactive oxygen species modulator 1-like [Corticium candelabrum]